MCDSTIDDDELVRQAGRGSQSAFRELFERYAERFLYFAFRARGHRQKAEDFTQETLKKAFKQIMDGEITDGKHFRNYAWKTLKGLVAHDPRDTQRENRAKAGYADMMRHKANGDEPDPGLDPDLSEEVRGQLSDDEWNVVELRVLEGLSNKEAADRLGITPEAAYKRYYRAMARLKTWLVSRREEE